VGGALTGIAALFGGLSLYLVAALILPVLECTLRYSSRLRVPQAVLLPVAVAVLLAHAAFLAYMQDGAVGVQKLAVNIAYVFTILVGAGVGGLIFRRAIAAAKLRAPAE
jgi:hypothetical protein